ncbi:MAG TPA: hypothetical protein VKU85_12125, partial [bacterium]|nr:hypothetical protein [bacterium]
LCALELATGKRVARWRSTPYPGFDEWQDVGRLMRRDDRVYFVTDEAFSEICVEDIERAGEGCCVWDAVPDGFAMPAAEP